MKKVLVTNNIQFLQYICGTSVKALQVVDKYELSNCFKCLRLTLRTYHTRKNIIFYSIRRLVDLCVRLKV